MGDGLKGVKRVRYGGQDGLFDVVVCGGCDGLSVAFRAGCCGVSQSRYSVS